jgi:DNA-directed RNA polymerase I, II, and III subunit RPABC3
MSGIASDAQLFEEHFRVERLSEPKYDRVDRLYCHSDDKSISMSLDVNKELFPCKVDDELHVALATSLRYDGSKDDERGWRDVAKAGASDATLADIFDYVCYGKIYKFEDAEDGKTM